jgi:hypothetical protein
MSIVLFDLELDGSTALSNILPHSHWMLFTTGVFNPNESLTGGK